MNLPNLPNENINTLKPFSRFCASIGAIPTSYLVSLTYEEQLLWLCDYLQNTVIPTVNNNAEAVTELQNLYIELRSYVDNYFTNLDVQLEINNKLDEMAESGQLFQIMQPYFSELETQINTLDGTIKKVETDTSNSISSLQNQLNSVVAGAGTEGSSSAEILQARTNTMAHTFNTLNDRINFIETTLPFDMQVVENIDFNQYVTPGKYIITSVADNGPDIPNLKVAILIVEALRPNPLWVPSSFQWIEQRLYAVNLNYSASRLIQRISLNPDTYKFNNWLINDYNSLNKLYNGNIDRNNLSPFYSAVSQISNTDFNDIQNTGIYLNTSTNNPNIPFSSGGILDVNSYYVPNESFKWIIQTYYNTTLTQIAKRLIRIAMKGGTDIIEDWQVVFNKTLNNDGFGLPNKKIVNFGDSIFGNFRDNTSVSSNISAITSAEVINVGFGGCRMSKRSGTTWDAFSMCNLATAVANQDFSYQENAINNSEWSDKPTYFNNTLNILKNIDFSNIDYITISYGTNDYTAGVILDNEENNLDINTFAGALRYSIETLLTAYPNLRILIGSPIFRLWLNEDKTEVIQTSDDRVYTPR